MTSLSTGFDFVLPTRVYAGNGALARMPDVCARIGTEFLLIASPDLSASGDQIVSAFEAFGLRVHRHELEAGEPACHVIDATAAKLRERKYHGVIGLGGGSAIDYAKAIAVALTQPHPIWSYANLATRPPLPLENQVLPVIAVPTTSGTGSEVTPYAVLTNEETAQKGTIQQPEIFPMMAFMDPSLTLTMPPSLTALTGFDALAHAMEAFINRSKVAPAAEWAAKEAIGLIFEHLPIAYLNPTDLEARAQMSWASMLAGIAIAHRGTTTAHAIAEPLGAITHLPHGFCVAAATVPVMERTWRADATKFERMYEVSGGASDKKPLAKASGFVDQLSALLDTIGLSRAALQKPLQDHGPGLADTVVSHIMGYKFRPLKQHPIEFGENDLKCIMQQVVGA